MTIQNTKVNFEEKWHGPESSGQFSGRPGIFLYYGNEGVDINYTVNSLTKQFEGWGWTRKIADHGIHVVFTYLREEGVRPRDPLYKTHSQEIVDTLGVQKHGMARVHTPGTRIPTDEVDEVVDSYTVRVPDGKFKRHVERDDEVIDWFGNESRRRDRAEFVVGLTKHHKSKENLQEFSKKYYIPKENIWLYPDGAGYDRVVKTANEFGYGVTLSPDYYKDASEGDHG